MGGRRIIAAACLASMIVISSHARADDSRLVSLRAEALTLGSRVQTVRLQAEHASPHVRRESERIIDTVEDRRNSLLVRLDIVDLLGRAEGPDDATVQDMERMYDSANRLLALVEGWYSSDR